MRKRKKYTIIIAGLVIFSAITLTGFQKLKPKDDFEIAKNLELYHSAVKNVRMYYVDEVDLAKLIRESLNELLHKLDPYTIFYSESKIEDYDFMRTGTYAGIGVTVVPRKGRLYITAVDDNYPAQKAGLKPGDIITSIDGKVLSEKKYEELKEKLKGPVGSSVDIKIDRPFENIKDLNITLYREKIKKKPIIFKTLIDSNIVYLKYRSFTQNSSSDFLKALQFDGNKIPAGIIIDLRGNPGGFLQEAVKILDYFIEPGKVLVKTKGRISQWNRTFMSKSKPIFADVPVVVIVNSRSASASEIVSGTFQDLDRAVIVGERTFGKGLVQTTQNLGYNTKIKITAAKYYLPGGRCVQVRDYSHLRDDGGVSKLPDSLRNEFFTTGGRSFFDGGGIKPDIQVQGIMNKEFIRALNSEFIIYDFATKYAAEHKSVEKPESYNYIDYIGFKNYVQTLNFKYKNEYIKKLEKLTDANNVEHPEVSSEIFKIIENYQDNTINYMDNYKKDILTVLEHEIILRYYGESGMYISITKKDPAIKKAVEVLKDHKKYNQILNIQ